MKTVRARGQFYQSYGVGTNRYPAFSLLTHLPDPSCAVVSNNHCFFFFILFINVWASM